MGTSAHSCQAGSQHRRINWRLLTVLVLTVGVLLASVSCIGKPADKVENPTVISYAGAASRLNGLEPTEAQEQLRDWARTGLAAYLELDTAQLRDAAYDTLPVRDLAFADLSQQSTGPGRALFDGRGVLHVLVAHGDPHEARTIGLLIDQHRSDAGADPQQVQVHHYQIYPGTEAIELTHEKPAATSEVRSAHGFVTMRVDEAKGLTDFLAQTRHLSWLEVRGVEIWAGGWNWPDVPAVPLDFEDVSIIQRGYLQPSSAPRPAFSLDPGPPETREDLLAVLPDLRPELVDRLITNDWNGSPFDSAEQFATAVDSALFWDELRPALVETGLPGDRSQLWTLSLLLAGRGAYSQARYDGRLEGTEVGMTLFYTDYVAKDWAHSGTGNGIPTKAVGGFIPRPEAVTSWSHCAGAEDGQRDEYGRLWFGQNDSGFSFDGDRVSIGAQATRLFSRSEADEGTEVEPSFRIGRGLRWWDQHYQAVADYEPQYQRLDQIMRWSGALDWLVSQTQAKLPQLDDAAIRSDLQFEDWYAQHGELRERSQIEFVTPPSATQEAILPKPSEVFADCGVPIITGGVSLGDVIQRKGGRSFQADLPEPVRRAGLFDEGSRFDPATGAGQIKQVSIDGSGNVIDSVQRTFSTTADGRAVIGLVADGRRVVPFGNLKVWRTETATRQLSTELAANRGQISQRVEFQGHELGELVARKGVNAEVNTVTIQWRPGLIDRARRVLESIQDRLTSQPTAELPPATDGVLYSLPGANGATLYKVGGPDAPWLSISRQRAPPGEEMVFRLGGPDPVTGTPGFFEGRLSQRPELPPVDGGPPGWMEVTPPTGGQPPRVIAAVVPESPARTVRVTTPDGRAGTVSQLGDRAMVGFGDQMLGLNGTIEGAAMLRDFPRVAEAMRSAADAKDGLLHGVRFGDDGVALASADSVVLAAADHPWASRVQQAISPDSPQAPRFQIEGGRLLHIDPSELTVRPGSTQRTSLDEALNSTSGDVYVHRSMLTVDNGMIVRDALPLNDNVIIQAADPPRPQSTVAPPDIRIHNGAQWQRVSGTGSPAGSGGGVIALPMPILLVCPDTDENIAGCEE